MSIKEILELVQIFSSFAVIISVIYASYQLKLLRKTHVDNHEWNRRKSAQDLAMNLNQILGDTAVLHERLQVINRKESIPLKEILGAIEEDSTLQLKIQKVLNIYSSVASGILNGVYDRKIIEEARKGAMIKTYDAFSSYINHRREESIPTLWESLESLTNEWKRDLTISNKRELTGVKKANNRMH